VDVGGAPVHPAAGGTLAETALRLEDIRGDPALDGRRIHSPGRFVAYEAAPAESSGKESGAVPPDHLAELLLQIRTLDEEGFPRRATADQPGVAGQKDPPFLARQLDQLRVFDPAKVSHIVTQNPQPPCQSPQHAVGGKAEREFFDTPGTLCYGDLAMILRNLSPAHRAHRFLLPGALLLLAAAVSILPAAPGKLKGRIRGTARDMKGRPVAGLLVELLSGDGGRVHITDTDDKGVYTFEDLDAGNYDVGISGSGYQRQIKKGIVVQPPFRNIVDFSLPPGPVGEATPASPVVYQPPSGETVLCDAGGEFTDKDRRPIPDVSMSLVNPVTGAAFRAQSDRSGKILIHGVPAGTYRVIVASPGFVTVELKDAAVSAGTGLTLKLSLVEFPLNFEGRPQDLTPEERPVPPDYRPPGA
jgi:carboxypeptidase family protein